MEAFSALLALRAGNSPVTGEPPRKGQWRGALLFSLIYAWTNDWENKQRAGDLRRRRAHYDVIVMCVVAIVLTDGHAPPDARASAGRTGTTRVPVWNIEAVSCYMQFIANWIMVLLPLKHHCDVTSMA